MKKKTLIWLGFLLLTLMNVVVFLNRKHFEYRAYRCPEQLYAACGEDCIEKWKQYEMDYPPADAALVNEMLDGLIPKNDSTTRKIEKLSAFLLERFDQQRGVPSVELLSKSPLGQFQFLRLHPEQKLWCGNWSNIYAYFAWNRQIPTRIVEVFKPGDHHVFNESYVPELGQWVLVDLTYKKVMPKDDKGNFFNGFSYAQFHASTGNPDAYYDTRHPWYYYRRYHLESIYSPESRVKRYLSPQPWYEILKTGKKQGGNFLFYVKLVVGGLWLMTFFMGIMGLLFRRK